MAEALGIDLRVATCAAARSRDGAVEPCALGEDGAEEVPAAELMAQAGGGPTRVVDAVEATRGVLAAVAERALGVDSVEAIGVAYALTPDDGPRLLAEQAASAAFGRAFLVPRVVAAAARFQHGGGMSAGDLAVLDVDGRDVEIAVVRTGPDGFGVLGTARVAAPASDDSDEIDMAAHFNEAVSALEAILTGTVGGTRGVQAVLVVGRSEWLDQLAVQVRVATGLAATVDPRPALAAAMGAALVAGGPEVRGRRSIAGAAAVLGPAAVPLAASLTTPGAEAAGAGTGAALGEALAGPGEAGSAIGAQLHDARGIGEAVGEAVGDGLAGKTAGDGALGEAMGEAVGDGLAGKTAGGGLRRAKDAAGTPAGGAVGEIVGHAAARGGAAGAAIGAAGRGRGRGRRRAVACGAAAAAALLVVAGVAAFGGGGGAGDSDEVETVGAGRTATTRARSGSRSDSGGPTTTVAATPATAADGSPDAVPAGAGPTTTVAGAVPPTVPGAPDPSGGTTPTAPADPGDPPPATVPTVPPDTTGPSVTGLSLSTEVVNEHGFEFCETPFTSTVTATITDPSGVASAAITWSGNGDSGAAALSGSGSTWSGTLGPVNDNPGLAYGEFATVTWTVTALDAAGNSTSANGPSLTVQGC